MDLIEKVKAAIERENLIPEGTRVVVGISGGADSVALLHILCRLGYSPTAAHLNHCIRGAEADADERFVKQLCEELGIKCVTARADVPALAKEKGMSIEMAAREARHAFFRSVLCSPSSVICLAHHADDQLETFFLRAARGTGPAGLGGMKSFQTVEEKKGAGSACFQGLENIDAVSSPHFQAPGNAVRTPRLQSSLTLIRPLLVVRHIALVDYLIENEMAWREDPSNADESIPRNRVHHQILPTLGKINERAAENILRTMQILRDEDLFPEKAAARRDARDRLIEFGVNPTFDAIEKLIEFSAKKNGTQFLDLEGLRITNEYGELKTVDATPSSRFSIRMEEGDGILRGKWQASVSLSKIAGRDVVVRASQPGDRMSPYGMAGSKKLQDIFTDVKIPKAQRADWPVVTCAGEIIWLPGYRIARRWELASDADPALHLFCDS